MFNPSKPEPSLDNPTQRANDVNDPQFAEHQGYFPYDLTHHEFVTPRFGEVTPTMNLHTVAGDRIVFKGNDKTVLTQIDGNFMSTVNEYSDSFFVPLRSLFPHNYEKLIPNPTKGQDLPLSALPQFNMTAFVMSYLRGENLLRIESDGDLIEEISISQLMQLDFDIVDSDFSVAVDLYYTRVIALFYMLSDGQLLDYLGYRFDGRIQSIINSFFGTLYANTLGLLQNGASLTLSYYRIEGDVLDGAMVEILDRRTVATVPEYRDAIAFGLENGYIMKFSDIVYGDGVEQLDEILGFFDSSVTVRTYADEINLVDTAQKEISDLNHHLNLSMPLAYQQIIAQYYSNNTVDNIFNAELFMQNLRSVMFPANGGVVSSYPVFRYNGVETEYDLISYASTYYSLIASDAPAGFAVRQYYFITLMFLLRNSLRYGDYFSTARPNMLAVGDLSINVVDGQVSPIDVTKNLLMQRYLNAANYIGSGFLPYFASIFGVTPSDTGTYPRFITHYKSELKSDITTNTSNNQGKQTTNLLGFTDGNSWDCFIDDFGCLLVLKSYDVLPVYRHGRDRTFAFSDRFDYFNPMLQNIGDQPILTTEFSPRVSSWGLVFGYTMRNAEYKFKISRAHGAFVNDLKGFYLPFPVEYYYENYDDTYINPNFIRDRPIFMDSVSPIVSAKTPAQYYHFIVSCVNQLQLARKIQATPPVLF